MTPLESFFSSVQLPPMNEVAQALIRTLDNEHASIAEIRDLIAEDPALTAKLLRLANSAQFGLRRGVGTLDEAIAMVGIARVRCLSLAACLNDSFPSLPGLDRQALWRNSTVCAGYAQWLASSMGMDGQVAWLTGLMLRLGELLMAQARPDVMADIECQPCLPGQRWEREKRLLGFTEGEITAELARRWNFPMQMVQALQRSADPVIEQAFSRLGAVIHLAAWLADMPVGATEDPTGDALTNLPLEVVDSLRFDLLSLQASFPDANSFAELSAL
jgi:HD-like signal output (HDOD) protein